MVRNVRQGDPLHNTVTPGLREEVPASRSITGIATKNANSSHARAGLSSNPVAVFG